MDTCRGSGRGAEEDPAFCLPGKCPGGKDPYGTEGKDPSRPFQCHLAGSRGAEERGGSWAPEPATSVQTSWDGERQRSREAARGSPLPADRPQQRGFGAMRALPPRIPHTPPPASPVWHSWLRRGEISKQGWRRIPRPRWPPAWWLGRSHGMWETWVWAPRAEAGEEPGPPTSSAYTLNTVALYNKSHHHLFFFLLCFFKRLICVESFERKGVGTDLQEKISDNGSQADRIASLQPQGAFSATENCRYTLALHFSCCLHVSSWLLPSRRSPVSSNLCWVQL